MNNIFSRDRGYATGSARLGLGALLIGLLLAAGGCSSAYKAQPVPFKLPSAYANRTTVAGAEVAAEAFVDDTKAEDLFGFDIRKAGLLPVRVVFDNRGTTRLVINPAQTFLVDAEGNLWPVLAGRFAYERVTHYAQTKNIFQEGAYASFLGGVAGAIAGAAVGVVSGEDVGSAIGKGAAVGAAAGALLGGAKGGLESEDAEQRLLKDFKAKSLKNKTIQPGNIAYGFIFFPGEAKTAAGMRLQLLDRKTKTPYTVELKL